MQLKHWDHYVNEPKLAWQEMKDGMENNPDATAISLSTFSHVSEFILDCPDSSWSEDPIKIGQASLNQKSIQSNNRERENKVTF